jgi:hypothetical protein
MRFNILTFSLLALFSLTGPRICAQKSSPAPNIKGQIRLFLNNNMPVKSSNQGQPLKATVYIYEPTRLDQIEAPVVDAFTTRVNSKRLATFSSDSLGNFKCYMKPGKYSIFIQYENAYYIPYFSGSNWVSLFDVKAKQITNLPIKVFGKNSNQ